MSLLRRTTALLGVTAAASIALAGPPPAAAGAATPPPASPAATADNFGAYLYVENADDWAHEVGVMAEPSLGRVEVHTWHWSAGIAGRYLHVGLGTTDGGACSVSRWIVVDKQDDDAPVKAYDAAWAPLPVESFADGETDVDDVERIEIGPYPQADCLRAAVYDGADPENPGPKVSKAPAEPFAPLGFSDLTSSPLHLTCPAEVPWGGEFEVDVAIDPRPGPLPDLFWPSHLGSASYTFEPSSQYTLVSSPTMPTDVDLWTAEEWTGSFVFHADPSATYDIDLGTIGFTRDGVTTDRGCELRRTKIPVSMPAPTDWAGSLAGKTWWWRSTSANSGIGEFDTHAAAEFLDDEWVALTGRYQAPRDAPCDAADDECHRYYYDEATGRLQIDDRLLRPRGDGWTLRVGTRASRPALLPDRVIATVETGKRFSYDGRSRFGQRLVLRMNGSYRYTFGEDRTWTGRYRFVGGDVQELVLRRPGKDARHEVLLFFGDRDGKRRLLDIETEQLRMRFSRW